VLQKNRDFDKIEGMGASTLHLLCTLCTAWIYSSWALVSDIKGLNTTIFSLSAFRVKATCNNYHKNTKAYLPLWPWIWWNTSCQCNTNTKSL